MAANENTKREFKLLKEVGKLFTNFTKRNKITESFLKQPNELRNLYLKMNIYNMIADNIIRSSLSCLMLLVNFFITHGKPILGIVFFIIYNARDIFNNFAHQYRMILINQISYLKTNYQSIIGGSVVGKVSEKVYDKKENYFSQVNNEEIVQTIKSYLELTWELENNYFFDFINIFTVLVMLFINIKVNTLIPTYIFIPLISISCILCLFFSAYDDMHHHSYAINRRESRNKKNIVINDIMRVTNIIPFDLKIRIQRLKNLSEKDFHNESEKRKNTFFTDSLVTLTSICGSSILIVLSLLNSNKDISLATITELTALLAIYNTTLEKIKDAIYILEKKAQKISELEKEEKLMKEIINVYQKEVSLSNKSVTSLNFSPFTISYTEQSENDKPFKLILDTYLSIKIGEIIALIGASGSGKSTFMKLATGRITFIQNDDEKLTPTNYMFYDETVGFGSLSIWEELFCLDEVIHPTPSIEDLQKMKYIFENLFLWKEISENSHDVWKWCKEHKYTNLSNGQKQRLVIAKILFWLNDDIDILALDECTSGLDNHGNSDNADAIKILQFIVKWCNRDKKRIILLSTHQNIDCICNRKLLFERTDGQTVIKEVPINS